jgi:Family of unknown function (DUF6876)
MSAMQLRLFVPAPDPAPQQSVPVPMLAPKITAIPNGLENLGQFCGTTGWYKLGGVFRNWVLTDGTQYLAETYKAFWLMDAIASYYSKLHKHPFQVWTLKVDKEKGSAVLSASNGNNKSLARQEIAYTNFPDDITLYAADNGEGYWVILLTSEY